MSARSPALQDGDQLYRAAGGGLEALAHRGVENRAPDREHQELRALLEHLGHDRAVREHGEPLAATRDLQLDAVDRDGLRGVRQGAQRSRGAQRRRQGEDEQ